MPGLRDLFFAACLAAETLPVRAQTAPTTVASPSSTPVSSTDAASTASPAPTSHSVEDFKTADALWKHFQEMQRGPRASGTREERAKAFVEFVSELRATAERFASSYPDDPRRWEAHMTAARLMQKVDKVKSQAEVEQLYERAAAAPDAPPEIRIKARLGLIQLHREALKDDAPKARLDAVEAEIARFAKDFPRYEALPTLETSRASLWEKRDPTRAEAILNDLSKSADEKVAKAASAELRLRNLKNQPLELQFTALDGSTVDTNALRGKVVLVHFWGPWHGAAAADFPRLVELYKKDHDKGLEILGIILDSKKERVENFLKEKQVSWPQYYDGKGLQNDIATSFAVHSLPVMWLVNKKGFVVATDARGKLEELVGKLLDE